MADIKHTNGRNNEFFNTIITKFFEYCIISMNYIQNTLNNMKYNQILDDIAAYASHHPFIALFCTCVTIICSIPLLIFILFAVFTTIVTFSGFVIIEGAILTVSSIILCGVLLALLLVFITFGICSGIFYFGMLKIFGLINVSPEESPVGLLIKSEKKKSKNVNNKGTTKLQD